MPGHPPIDPEIAAALADPSIPPASLYPADIPAGRERAVANALSREQLARGGAITVSDVTLPGPGDNPSIHALVLSPAGPRVGAGETGAAQPDPGPLPAEPAVAATPAPGLRPGIVFIHGGGMIMGSRFNIDESMLEAVELGIVVISPEYRLAPEHPYPAPVYDCYTAWSHIAAHAEAFGIDPARLAIAGSSAGGGLAAGVTLLARDRGGALPRHQILFCPMLDDREITASSQELDGVGRWDKHANRTGWSAYLGDRRGGDDVPPYAAPARATDLSGLPPTFIDVGDVETFRDENIDYSVRLSRAGVPAELHVWPGGVHGFTGIAPQAGLSQAAMAVRRGYLRWALLG